MASKQNDITNSDALQDLEDRLEEAQARHAKPDPRERANKAIGFKYASDFSAAIIVGAMLGYGIDKLLGSMPWGLLIGLILGFAAGVLSITRAAQEALATTDLGQDLPPEQNEDEDET